MSNLTERLSALSPEKRALLQRRLMQARKDATPAPAPIPRHSRDANTFPLSATQERMWFNHQLQPDIPLYNEAYALRIDGPLHVDCLAQSFEAVMQRHELFSLVFHDIDGQPMQTIAEGVHPKLVIVDLGTAAVEARQAELQCRIRHDIQQRFTLDRGPLFRGTLFCLGEQAYVFLCVMHHIIFDGLSVGLYFQELFTFYNAFSRQVAPALTVPAVQYVDYVLWQRESLHRPAFDPQVDYWRQQLAGVRGVLELPTDHPRPASSSGSGGREFFRFSRRLSADLKAFSQREQTTLFMTLLAGFKALLYAYTGQTDIVVGVPTTNRNHKDIESMLGVFINTLPLRTQFAETASFRDLLSRVQASTTGAYANPDVPFEKLVELAQPERDPGRTPLFQVLFNFHKTLPLPIDVPDLDISAMDNIDHGMTKFDVTLSIEESEHFLKGRIEYSTDLFETPTIQRLLGHFQTLLAAVTAAPETPLSALPLLTPAEYQQILVDWNATEATLPQGQCLVDLFEAQAERTPDAVAAVWKQQRLTYGELNASANQVAHRLRALHITPDCVVGICLERSLEMLISQLGVLKSGGAYLSLDQALPIDRLQFMVSDAQVSVVLTQEKFASAWRAAGRVLIVFDGDQAAVAGEPTTNLVSHTHLDHSAYVIYTSGSTGRPKGVVIPHRGLLNLACWHQHAFGISATDRATQLASTAFDASVWEVWPYLTAGASLYLVPPDLVPEPLRLRDWLLENEITVSFAPTPLAEELLLLDWPSDLALRLLLTGGDRLHHYPSEAVPFTVVNNYGPTENTVVATSGVVPQNKHALTLPSIGRPIANTQVYILSRHLQPVPIGVPGELYIGGASLARGYLNRPELTEAQFMPHPFSADRNARLYKTGDLGRYRPDGTIAFLGREGQQVQLRGFRIELGEIEAVLAQHPTVREAVVTVHEDAGSGVKRLLAYVSPNLSHPGTAAACGQRQAAFVSALQQHLQATLPVYMVPSTFMVLDALPLTANGKVDRAALPEPLPVGGGSGAAFMPPQTDLEEKLAACWAQVLGLTTVSGDDNFFTLGGYSLLAPRLASMIQQSVQRHVPLHKLFEFPTVAGLAQWLVNGARSPEAQQGSLPACVIPIQSSGRQRPLFFVHPASGSPLCYLALASRLGPHQPIYGFQAPGLQDDAPLLIRLEDMAAHYIAAMRCVQPVGPYQLAGWSFGSMVAFEMARMLEQEHEAVSFLGLLDTGVAPQPAQPGARLVRDILTAITMSLSNTFSLKFPASYQEVRVLVSWFGVSLPESLQQLWQRDWSSQWRFCRYLLKMSLRSLRLFRSNFLAGQQYHAAPYGGRAILFRTSQRLSHTARDAATLTTLQRLVRGGLEILEVPGNHMTMLHDPNVGALAEQMQAVLKRL